MLNRNSGPGPDGATYPEGDWESEMEMDGGRERSR